MDKKYKEKYKGKTISLVFNDSKQTDLYESWASQFRPELFNAIKAGIDGEDPATVLRHSLECYGLSRPQEDLLINLLPYFMVEDDKKNTFDFSHLKEVLTIPHFELPNFLKEDKRRLVGLAIGCILLVAIPLWAAYYFMNKSESPKEIAQAEVVSQEEPTTVPTASPSRFQDLLVGDGEATSPVVNASPTVTTEVEPTIDNQPAVAVEENETAPTTVSAYAIRQLIVNDDEIALKSLFVGQKLLIEADGFCSDYISEQCANLIRSGNIKLVFDNASPSLLKKIVIK